jgi:hypothetical protein
MSKDKKNYLHLILVKKFSFSPNTFIKKILFGLIWLKAWLICFFKHKHLSVMSNGKVSPYMFCPRHGGIFFESILSENMLMMAVRRQPISDRAYGLNPGDSGIREKNISFEKLKKQNDILFDDDKLKELLDLKNNPVVMIEMDEK